MGKSLILDVQCALYITIHTDHFPGKSYLEGLDGVNLGVNNKEVRMEALWCAYWCIYAKPGV